MPYLTAKRPTEALIDLDALAFNFHASKEFIGADVKYMAVVKADGYGHGAVECAMRLEREGVDWFGVAIPEEGVELRKAGIKCPILCLGSFWPGQEELIVDFELTTVIYDLDTAAHLAKFAANKGITLDIHVKIDTGMGRVGVGFRDVPDFALSLKHVAELNVTGLLTHFASADDPLHDEFTKLQIERFDTACKVFVDAGHTPIWFDLANSPGAISHPGSRKNLVRLGGALYGLIDDILPFGALKPALRPVLSLRSRVAHLRKIIPGEGIGYGLTFTAERDSVIALVPMGYADGYPRGLSNKAYAYVNGQKVPVVGRISMDWTLLDVTDVGTVAISDDVFLVGGGTDHAIKAADLAEILGTIGYEITCGISPRVPRVYYWDGQIFDTVG